MSKKSLYVASALVLALVLAGNVSAKSVEPATKATPEAAKTVEPKATDKQSTQTPPPGMKKVELSEASQKLLREAMGKTQEANKATMEEIKAKHKELGDILQAAKFDKEDFLEKTAEIQALHAKMMRSRDEAFASVAGQLTPDERAAFVGRGPHRGEGKGPGDKPSKPQ